MSGHVVDRFLHALPVNSGGGATPYPSGYFRASPEIARMLRWHASYFSKWHDMGETIFGYKVVPDPSVERGGVIFVEDTP